MLCEKCGKNNEVNSKKCRYCGADMPERSVCGGFGDILTYDAKPETKESPNPNSGVSNEEIKKLSRSISALKIQKR